MPALTSASKPSSTILIDKPRQIRFNWSAGCRFEEAYGKSILRAMSDEAGMRLVTFMAWAGMLHAEPTVSVPQVEKRIQAFINNDGDINLLATELVGALVSSGILGKVTKKPVADDEATEEPGEDSEGNAPAATDEE